MKIRISKNKYGSLFAVSDEKYYLLFQFEYRETEEMGGPAWYFWLRGDYDPDFFKGEKKDFPMEFFKDACRAKMFIITGEGLHDEVEIVKGENILTE